MPVLVTLKVWLPELPTVTFPKLKLVGDALQDKTCAEMLGAFSRQYIVSIIEVESWDCVISLISVGGARRPELLQILACHTAISWPLDCGRAGRSP
jgi:hypothetical protein